MHRTRLHSINRLTRPSHRLAAFTLVELLIVVAVLLILSTLTLAMFNSTSESDRIRSSARQLQSALLGARDRAIHAKAPRGLRLLIQDNTDPSAPAAHLVTSMVYIGAEEEWTNGRITLERPDFDIAAINHNETNAGDGVFDLDELVVVKGSSATLPTDWSLLLQQGLIQTGSRIEIPKDSNQWFTIDTSLLVSPPSTAGPNDEFLVLARNGFRGAIAPNGTYRLELRPTILAGQEPLRMSGGVVIDLSRSVIPSTWSIATGSLDILFSPRGWAADSPLAPISPSGLIHFYICTQTDADLGLAPTDPKSGEKLILTFYPRTGNVATYPVDVTTSDPFSYAKRGGTAGR